jgi:hypothetical protein
MQNLTTLPKIESLDLKFLPTYDSAESEYFSDTEIEFPGSETLSLIFDLNILNYQTYDAGDYFTAPSVDGELKLELEDLHIYNYDDFGNPIKVEDENYTAELKKALESHYGI